jgi:molecular chaperone HscB
LYARYAKAICRVYLCGMNYFELFGIPEALAVDKSQLAHRYFELQKKYHPDFYTSATEAEKAEVLEKSAMVNKAFKTFQNTDATIQYLLQLKGLVGEEEKYALPPDFLMEMMELNEALTEDGQLPDGLLAEAEAALYEGVRPIVAGYTPHGTTAAELAQVKEYFYKKKYLLRIKERIRNIAAQNGERL